MIRRFVQLLAALALLLGGLAGPATGGTVGGHSVVSAADVTNVVVHYHRFDDNYATWDLWMWPYLPTAGNGVAYEFDGTDAFGKVAHVAVPGANTQVGLIVRKNDWSDREPPGDRHINTPGGKGEVWVIQGDPTDYYSQADAEKALVDASKIKPVNAFLDGTSTVVAKFSHPTDLATLSLHDFVVTDTVTNAAYSVTALRDLTGATTGRSDVVKFTLSGEPDITHLLQFSDAAYPAVRLMPRLVLDDPKYYYAGSDLGATYTATATSFRLWAPLASAVSLTLYSDEAGTVIKKVDLAKRDNGTWATTVSGDLKNVYYDYAVTNFGNTATAVDPYARGVAVDGKYGMIVDLASTNPTGWSKDTYRKTKNPVDASIYEVHVRDFSIDPSSGMKHRGKYLAFTEKGTHTSKGVKTGVDSIKQLGFTHVELMPVFGCATLDDVLGGSTTLVTAKDGQRYNWCYDPKNYNAPNGAYATDPHGTTRITELKQAVQSLHSRGLGVIMDVVYNHTYSRQVFDPIVPGYFYRTNYAGQATQPFGFDEVATDRPMVRKFVMDSTAYWAKEYHMDGFRFDLMSILGKDTMAAVAKQVRAINPSAVLLGEPWDTSGSSILNDTLITQGTQKGLHIGMFNDHVRNALGNDPFTDTAKGYATGDPTKIIGIETGLVGATNYDLTRKDFALHPEESINYVTSHDNMTLWDRIKASNPTASVATRKKMDTFAQAIVFTSQGVPFMQGGEEFLRSKGGNHDSYDAGDLVNRFDWTLKGKNASVFNYYAGLLALRNAHPAFRIPSEKTIADKITIKDNTPKNTIVFTIDGHANGDKWKSILVIYNPNPTKVNIKLPAGTWNVVGTSGKIGTRTLGHAKGKIAAPGYTATVMYQK